MATTWQDIFKEDIDKEIDKATDKRQLDDVKSLMETLGLSIDKAMDALKIPPDKRASYMSML